MDEIGFLGRVFGWWNGIVLMSFVSNGLEKRCWLVMFLFLRMGLSRIWLLI